MDDEERKQDGSRGEHGRFRAGCSGNPAGRPKGSRNRMTTICSDLLSEASEEVMAKVLELARAGDGPALKLCVERLVPMKAARDRAVEVELPDVTAGTVRDLVAAAAAVIDHAGHGRISLSEAREFMALLEGERKLVETADLAVRIEALELRAQQSDVVGRELGLGPDLRSRVRSLDDDAVRLRPSRPPEGWR